MNETKRVFCLYRVSTIGQVEKDDIPMQKEYCRGFIAEHPNWHLERELFEKGVSGFKKSAKERDAILELQTMALQKEFDVLLVYMFDRLGRKDDETPFIVEWFVQNGIEVWSAKEGQRRFDNHVDKLLNYITFWQASGESIKTSIRTKTRMEQLTHDGLYTGGPVCYGYQLVHNGRTNKRNRSVHDIEIDEEAAETIRLIFDKYVNEGYGAQRLSHYLAEHNIVRPDGRNFPNTSLNHILKNRRYIGVICNGEAESEIMPELQIIDPETFERAQKLMEARTTHHKDTPMNMRGHALLAGNVYCGHCRNRLTMATSGDTWKGKDGTIKKKTRFRYQCHYGVRHPGECDGKSVYAVKKLDNMVEQIMLYQLGKIQASDGRMMVKQAHEQHIKQAKAVCRRCKKDLETSQKELADYQSEILRIIRGDSSFTQDMLAPMISKAQAEVDRLTDEYQKAEAEVKRCEETAEQEMREYKQLQTWADLYRTCTFEAKKMIVSQFIKSIYVYSDYRLEIEFNVSFEDFQRLAIEPEIAENNTQPSESISA